MSTPTDYLNDACKILGFDPAPTFGPERSQSKPHAANRRRAYLYARKLAAEDWVTFVGKQWADAVGVGDTMIYEYDRPKTYKVRQRIGSIEDVIEATIKACGVRREALFTNCRHPDVVRARMLISRAARTVTDCSYPEIAKAIGRPNHSTIITAEQRFSRLTADGKCPHLIDMLAQIVAECDRLAEANKPVEVAA